MFFFENLYNFLAKIWPNLIKILLALIFHKKRINNKKLTFINMKAEIVGKK